jgi:GNAT superfamily N-acetyltransferase
MELVIRPATPADARLLSDLRLESRINQPVVRDGPWEDFSVECTRVFEAALRDGSLRSWLAYDGDRPIGTATLALLPTLPRFEHLARADGRWLDGRIRNVYVIAEYRRRGIALALMRCALDAAEREGVDRLSLGTSDMGRPLYERLGFHQKDDELVWPHEPD